MCPKHLQRHVFCSFDSFLWLVTLLPVTSHESCHAMPLLVSHISPASSFCVNGYYSSLSHNEQQEGVVNVSLRCFVRIKLWLIVKTLSNFCGAYLQQGFLFPKSLFLPLPTSSPRRFLKPLQLFSSPCLLEKLLTALQGGNTPQTQHKCQL